MKEGGFAFATVIQNVFPDLSRHVVFLSPHFSGGHRQIW